MPKRGNTEGSIYFQASKQRWVAAITQEDGKRKWIYGKTREQVAAKLPGALVQVQQGIPFTPETLTVGKQLGNWLVGVRPSVRPKTYRSYEQLVRVHITPALGKIRLVKLQKTDIKRFLAQREQAGSSPRTRITCCPSCVWP